MFHYSFNDVISDSSWYFNFASSGFNFDFFFVDYSQFGGVFSVYFYVSC